jgi:nucleotidyltransferase/DNA polymerase involved in DNA repair
MVPARHAGDGPATLDPLPVSRLWTVGKVAGAKLEREGIRSFRDLSLCPRSACASLFGSHGPEVDTTRQRQSTTVPYVPDREDKS